jgi:hypothetical protein
VLAKELASQGFDVVVLEAGPWQQPSQFTHDELAAERDAMPSRVRRSRRFARAKPIRRSRTRVVRSPTGGASAEAASISPRTTGDSARSTSRSDRSGGRSAAPGSPTGRLPTRSSSRTTRRSTGRSEFLAHRARSIRRGRVGIAPARA